MPCASHNHIGHLMSIRMSGFGVFSSFDGIYVLDLEYEGEKIYRRGTARICLDSSAGMWVIKDGDIIIGSQGAENIRNHYSTPIGDWNDGKKVISVGICLITDESSSCYHFL